MQALKISLLVFILSITISAQWESLISTKISDTVYLPLQVGNTWQYLKTFTASGGPSYSLSYKYVEGDSIIGNKKYFKYTDFADLVRYSTAEKKMYIRWNDSDYVHIDFSMPNGTPYQHFSGGNFSTVYAEAGEDFIFSLDRVYGGYFQIYGISGYKVWFTDSIGMSYDRYADSYIDIRREVIQAILYDSTGNVVFFTDHHKPTFQLTPITLINSENFNLDFMITHYYTKVGNLWNSGLDFIDSVRMYSYYSKNDSIIHNFPIIPYHITNPANVNYSISIQIDSMLLKNGFVFNYRFRAKDKGIISEFSNSPDTGYYQCIWDTITSIIEPGNGSSNDFLLSQNYPNPFNPVTKIKYTIAASLNPSKGGTLVQLIVYDILGREVKVLVNEEKQSGAYEIEFDGGSLPSGVYLYRLTAGNFSETKKLVLLK